MTLAEARAIVAFALARFDALTPQNQRAARTYEQALARADAETRVHPGHRGHIAMLGGDCGYIEHARHDATAALP